MGSGQEMTALEKFNAANGGTVREIYSLLSRLKLPSGCNVEFELRLTHQPQMPLLIVKVDGIEKAKISDFHSRVLVYSPWFYIKNTNEETGETKYEYGPKAFWLISEYGSNAIAYSQNMDLLTLRINKNKICSSVPSGPESTFGD